MSLVLSEIGLLVSVNLLNFFLTTVLYMYLLLYNYQIINGLYDLEEIESIFLVDNTAFFFTVTPYFI